MLLAILSARVAIGLGAKLNEPDYEKVILIVTLFKIFVFMYPQCNRAVDLVPNDKAVLMAVDWRQVAHAIPELSKSSGIFIHKQ